MASLFRILEDLWQFRSSLPGVHHPCNGYILRRSGEIFLIDPPADLSRGIVQEATGLKCVKRIFLTHVQAEHGGGLKHFGEALIHVPEGNEYLCRGIEAYAATIKPWPEPWEWETRGNYEGHLAGARNERPLAHPVSLAECLYPGGSLDGFEIVSTPGHGKHAVSLIADINGQRVAFCGDLIFGDGQVWNWFDCDWDYGLETGRKALLGSARLLATCPLDLLCPAHGDVIRDPERALRLLEEHLGSVISPFDPDLDEPLNFPDVDSPAPGFRQITPHIHQWRTGNTMVLTSDDGFALVVDDGLCIWEPLEQRTVKHDTIFREMKAKLGIKGIEWVVPTHYHGDHTDYVSHLARNEGARVIALDSIAEPMEFPERYNLAAPLPWYDSFCKVVNIDVRVPEGFVLHWRDYALTFFHLGGQTFYHLGIEAVVDGLKVLFVGDSWWGTRSSSPILCWNDAEPRTRGWVYGLDRMIERSPDLLVCGHGSALRDPLPYLRKARVEWDERLDAYAVLNPRPTDNLFFNPFFS